MYEIQSIIFDAEHFTKKEVNEWLKDHDYKKLKPVSKEGDHYRARITFPDYDDYFSKKISKYITLVFGKL